MVCKADLPGQKEKETRVWSDDGRVFQIRRVGNNEKLN